MIGCALCMGGFMQTAAADAAEPAAVTLPQPGEDTVTLLEESGLYDDFRRKVGEIAPQTVKVLETRQARWGHGEGYNVTMYLIPTWMGNRWIVQDMMLVGNPKPIDTKVDLGSVEPLYNDPRLTEPAGWSLAPQIVTAKAHWSGNYLIETKSGDKWIRPRYPYLQGVQEVREQVELLQTARLMKYPYYQDTGSELAPQTVEVKEVWRNWHRIDSWMGPVWFRRYEAEAVDEQHRLEVNFGYLRRDEKDPNVQLLTADVQLGPQHREGGSGEQKAAPVEFTVRFYNEAGERIAASRPVRTELLAGRKQPVELVVEGKLDHWFAYATVQSQGIDPHAAMTIADPDHPGLRLGGLNVRRDGEYSVITGQYALEAAEAARVIGRLIFMNGQGVTMGTVPFEAAAPAGFQGKSSQAVFELLYSGNVSGYASVKLEVDTVVPN